MTARSLANRSVREWSSQTTHTQSRALCARSDRIWRANSSGGGLYVAIHTTTGSGGSERLYTSGGGGSATPPGRRFSRPSGAVTTPLVLRRARTLTATLRGHVHDGT